MNTPSSRGRVEGARSRWSTLVKFCETVST